MISLIIKFYSLLRNDSTQRKDVRMRGFESDDQEDEKEVEFKDLNAKEDEYADNEFSKNRDKSDLRESQFDK